MKQNSNPLPQLWRFDPADYPNMGTTFLTFLGNLNIFTQAIYNILNGGISFSNLQRALYSVTVTANTTTKIVFSNPLTIPPSGITLVQCLEVANTATPLTTSVSVANWTFSGTTVTILNVSGLTSGKTYKIVLEVM